MRLVCKYCGYSIENDGSFYPGLVQTILDHINEHHMKYGFEKDPETGDEFIFYRIAEKPKYVKKPIPVEAVQMEPLHNIGSLTEYLNHLPAWARAAFLNDELSFKKDVFVVTTKEGNMEAKYGSYLVQGVRGEIYPVAEDIFEATYEEVF